MVVSKEKFKTYGSVFDEKTRQALNRLEGKRVFDNLLSPISEGKEAHVFSAESSKGLVCVKVYRLNTCDFKRMYKYISLDRRIKGLQKRKRSVIHAWAKREFRNLKIARKAGVLVPEPIAFFENVLVMEYLGGSKAAPLLKFSKFDVKKYGRVLVNEIKKLYKAKLVHGDLSEFNILDHNGKPYIIDLSHGMKLDYPNVDEYLERDVRTTVKFLNKRGSKLNYEEVLEKIKNG